MVSSSFKSTSLDSESGEVDEVHDSQSSNLDVSPAQQGYKESGHTLESISSHQNASGIIVNITQPEAESSSSLSQSVSTGAGEEDAQEKKYVHNNYV